MKRAEKKAATRELILQTAVALFARQGYASTTISQITEACGVAKGTFFNYFDSKEAILLGVGESQYQWGLEQLDALASQPGPLGPRLTSLLTDLARRMPFSPTLLRNIFQVTMASPVNLSGNVTTSQALANALIPHFRRGQELGEFTTRYSAEELSFLTLQTYFGALLTWSVSQEGPPLDAWMATSMEIFFRGVAAAG